MATRKRHDRLESVKIWINTSMSSHRNCVKIVIYITQFRTRVFVFQVFSVQGGNSTDVKIHSSEVKMYSADVKIQVKNRNQQIAILCDVAYKVAVIGGKSATIGMGYAAYFVVIRTRLDLLSIPQSGGKNVKTFRWDHGLQTQNRFMAFKRVALWW